MAPPPNNPLRPLTGAQIANQIAGYVNQLPAPLTDHQIQSRAQGLLDPIVQSLTTRYGDMTKSGASAISGYANQLAQNLGQYGTSAKQIYGDAAKSQAATDSALASATQGGGLSQANDLSGLLDKIGANQPNVNQATAGQVAQNGVGAGNALLGTGSASLSQLLTQGAAAQDYGAKLPGIARQQGLADIQQMTLANQKNLGDATAQVEQQLPGIVQNYQQLSDSRANNRSSLRNQLFQYLSSNNVDVSKFLRAEKDAGINATVKANAAVQTANIKAQTAKEAAQAKAGQTSFDNRLKFAKTYGYDPVTGATLPGYTKDANGHVVKAATPKGKGAAASVKGQLTDATAARLVQQWHDGKPTSVTRPVVDPKTGQPTVNPTSGKPVTTTTTAVTGNLNYGQAYAMLRQFHKTDAQARALLNTVYAKGDSGRAWVTNEEQAALKKAGIPYKAKLVTANGKQHGLLGPRQYATLKKAGLLPPGTLTQEGWYVIATGN